MDILKKLLEINQNNDENNNRSDNNNNNIKSPTKSHFFNEFRKPFWLDEEETDDELFDDENDHHRHQYNQQFKVFTNPNEMHQFFEQQLKRILKDYEENAENSKSSIINGDNGDDLLKPGFTTTDQLSDDGRKSDTEIQLDIELNHPFDKNEFHSLFERLMQSDEFFDGQMLKKSETSPWFITTTTTTPTDKSQRLLKEKLLNKRSDEEKFMDAIHGLNLEETIPATPTKRNSTNNNSKQNKKQLIIKRSDQFGNGSAATGAGGGGGGTNDGRSTNLFPNMPNFGQTKFFGQSIITQTIRKPDGTSETRHIVRDSDGNTKTTMTRTQQDGKTESITTYKDSNNNERIGGGEQKSIVSSYNDNNNNNNNNTIANNVISKVKNHFMDYSKYISLNNGYAVPKNIW